MHPHPPSTALFDETEQKLYHRWQKLTPNVPDSSYTLLPTAIEYADYLVWRDTLQDLSTPKCEGITNPSTPASHSPYPSPVDLAAWKAAGLDIAQQCGHPLHPSTAAADFEREYARCPVCTLRAHWILLSLLEERFTLVGGPWREYHKDTHPKGKNYTAQRRALHWAKSQTANVLFEIEIWAHREWEWEERNPDAHDFLEVLDPYSATAALEASWERELYPRLPVDKVRMEWVRPNERKRVTFTEETGGQKRARHWGEYLRSSRAYEPGPHSASPSENGWEDTSFMRDPLYNLSQVRILQVVLDIDRKPEVYYIDRSRDENAVARLQNLLDRVLETIDDPITRDGELEYLRTTSDYFIVNNEKFTVDENFDMVVRLETLVDSDVEEYARMVGEIEPDEEPPAAKRREAKEHKSKEPDIAVSETEVVLVEDNFESEGASSEDENSEVSIVSDVEQDARAEQEDAPEDIDYALLDLHFAGDAGTEQPQI